MAARKKATKRRKLSGSAQSKAPQLAIFGVPVPYTEAMSMQHALIPLGESLVITSEGGRLSISLGSQQVFGSVRRLRDLPGTPSGFAQTCQLAEQHLRALRTALNKLPRKG